LVLGKEAVEQMKRHIVEYCALLLILLSVGSVIQQGLFCGEWFSIEDFWHHESFIVMGIVSAVSLLIGKYVYKKFG